MAPTITKLLTFSIKLEITLIFVEIYFISEGGLFVKCIVAVYGIITIGVI